MQPWQIVDLEGCLYYAFLPMKRAQKMKVNQSDLKQGDITVKNETNNAEDSFTVVNDDNVYTDAINNVYVVKIEDDNVLSMNELPATEEEDEDKVYACDECNICFPMMQMLKHHQDTIHIKQENIQENIVLEDTIAQQVSRTRVKYNCNFCNYESTNKSTFHSHISRKHSAKHVVRRRIKRRTIPKPQELSCDTCGFKCQSRRRLKEHLDRKHGSEFKFHCEYCDKKFKVKGDMRLHVRFKHKESPIICDVCGKTCSNSNSLYVHQKWAHFKPKYECEICKRRMVTQENLDQHILLQHERRESFVCEECGKSFSENHRLKQHMMTHTGDRPYDCHICGKAFARRTAYRQHLLIHTGKRPYICDICGKAFTQKPGLICHRKSHPGVHPPLPVVHIDHILNDFMKKE